MEKDLTTGSVLKNIVFFSLPYLLSYFLQTLYGMADLFIIGQFDSVASITAVSVGSQVMHMLTVMIVGLAMGATVTIGKAIGGKQMDQASLAVGNTATLFMGIAGTVMIVLLLLVKPIVAVMSTPAAAVSGTITYLTICFIGIPFITAYNIISSIFRGLGDSKSPMYFIIVACGANILLKPVGTMAHEWIMCVGQGNHKHNPAYSNWYALDAWVKEYGVLNGIALTDAITTDCFLRDFQLTYATLFSGVRHDSGDPFEWGEKMITHYEKLGIDPTSKTLLFSDALDFERANALYSYFNDRVKVAFGIGTYISNDTDVPALNIVMKTTACNGMDVAKISDTRGKGMCKNPDYVEYLQRCINWRMENDK